MEPVLRRRTRHTRHPTQRRRRWWCAAQSDDRDRAPQRGRAPVHRRLRARSAPRPPSGSAATPAASPSSPTATTSCTRASPAAPPTHRCAPCTSAPAGTANTPAAPPPANSRATTSIHDTRGGKAVLDNMILLCPRHHTLLHDHHIVASGHGANPVFTDRTDAPSPPTNPTHHPADRNKRLSEVRTRARRGRMNTRARPPGGSRIWRAARCRSRLSVQR